MVKFKVSIGLIILRMLELAVVCLIGWAVLEWVTWRPGGTGLFDFPVWPIQLSVIAGVVSFPTFIVRLCIPMKSLCDFVEAQLLMLPWLAVFGSYLILALAGWFTALAR